MCKKLLTERRREQAIARAREYKGNLTVESECSELKINAITGTVEQATFSTMRDCSIAGNVKLGPGSSMISCVVPAGVTVEVDCCCMLIGVKFKADGDITATGHIKISSGCFILYGGILTSSEVLIGANSIIIESVICGDISIGGEAVIWSSEIRAKHCSIGSYAVFTGVSYELNNVCIGSNFTAASYNDIVWNDRTRWALSENAAEGTRVNPATRFELTSIQGSLVCGNDLSILAQGSFSITDGGKLCNGVTIMSIDEPSGNSSITSCSLNSINAKDNSVLVFSRKTVMYVNRVQLPSVDLVIGNSASVLLTGILAKAWGHHSGKISVKDNTTVNL